MCLVGSTMSRIERAQGCLAGQLAGDALGSLVEFQSPRQIELRYPEGVRELADGGTWDTIAGQPTDDSEMALLLARMLVESGAFSAERATVQYQYWLDSEPFDCGMTIAAGLRGQSNAASQANGALMRVSPLGVFGAGRDRDRVAQWAMADAAITHPNLVCLQVNALFVMAIAHVVECGCDGVELYHHVGQWAGDLAVDESVLAAIEQARHAPPADFMHQQGWVLLAFQNALYQLLHEPSVERAVVDTVMRGGDTDTNAAICGALLGAVAGVGAIPQQWLGSIRDCRPVAGSDRVRRPRPECFWPVDFLELAEQLVSVDLVE